MIGRQKRKGCESSNFALQKNHRIWREREKWQYREAQIANLSASGPSQCEVWQIFFPRTAKVFVGTTEGEAFWAAGQICIRGNKQAAGAKSAFYSHTRRKPINLAAALVAGAAAVAALHKLS